MKTAKIAKLDKMVQEWASRQRSYLSGAPAECGHHYIGRADYLLRWDLKNIVPLTLEEHRMVHLGLYDCELRNPFRAQYLANQKNKGLKTYLLERGMTFDEFIQERLKKLLEALDAKI